MALCESIIRPFLNLGRNGLRDALSHTNTSSNLSNCSSCWFRITIYLIKVIKKAKLHWQWFLQSLSSCILCWYSWRTEDDIYSISRKLFAFLFSDKIPWMCKECSCPAMSGSMRCKSDFCSLLNELFSELFSGIERRDHISWNIIAINVETEARRIKLFF